MFTYMTASATKRKINTTLHMTYINVFTEGRTKVYEFFHQVKIALNFNFFSFGHFSVLAHSLYIVVCTDKTRSFMA